MSAGLACLARFSISRQSTDNARDFKPRVLYLYYMSEFDFTSYVKASTKASGVPLHVRHKSTLNEAAKLVRSILAKRSARH
jgi:hypothetical protein